MQYCGCNEAKKHNPGKYWKLFAVLLAEGDKSKVLCPNWGRIVPLGSADEDMWVVILLYQWCWLSVEVVQGEPLSGAFLLSGRRLHSSAGQVQPWPVGRLPVHSRRTEVRHEPAEAPERRRDVFKCLYDVPLLQCTCSMHNVVFIPCRSRNYQSAPSGLSGMWGALTSQLWFILSTVGGETIHYVL